MYNRYSIKNPEFSTVNVDFSGQSAGMPWSIAFTLGCGRKLAVSVASFQWFRHQFPVRDDGHEEKLQMIKHLRGLADLGLKDSKDVVEYFLDHFTRDAGEASFR